jgi:hypothetical protein
MPLKKRFGGRRKKGTGKAKAPPHEFDGAPLFDVFSEQAGVKLETQALCINCRWAGETL